MLKYLNVFVKLQFYQHGIGIWHSTRVNFAKVRVQDREMADRLTAADYSTWKLEESSS